MRIVGNAFKERKNLSTLKPIYLYTLQLDPISNTVKLMCNWTNDVTFDGELYEPFAITHSGISEDGSGKSQKSRLTMANVSRETQALIDANNGLIGRKVIIKQVFYEELADPTAFISDTYYISDTLVTEDTASFSLETKLNVLDIRIPKRDISRSFFGNVSRFGGFANTPFLN